MQPNEFHDLDGGLGPVYLLDVGEIQHFREVWTKKLDNDEIRNFYAVCWMAEHFWTLGKKVQAREDSDNPYIIELETDLDKNDITIRELRDEIIELNELVLSLR